MQGSKGPNYLTQAAVIVEEGWHGGNARVSGVCRVGRRSGVEKSGEEWIQN